MPLSLYEIAFDHIESCPSCNLREGVICRVAMDLFQAAREKCEALVSAPGESPIKA
jgi:hypothetical protein